MKRSLKLGALLLSTILLFSCATSVGIGYTSPSEIDMGHYRNIGVASTVPFEGFLRPGSYIATMDDASTLKFGFVFSNYNYFLKDQVADYATQRLVGTLENTGYFNVTRPKKVDAILGVSRYQDVRDSFKKNNIDAVIIPKVDSMAVNEYIHSKSVEKVVKDTSGKETKKVETTYYYTSQISMVYSYVIVDTQTEKIVARKSFPLQGEKYTVQITDPHFSYSIGNAFSSLIDSIQYDIVNQLVPREEVIYETLMENKPEVPGLKNAYSAVDDGMYSSAFTVFYREWNESHHLPSGYNAALLLAASGKYDDAIRLLDDVTVLYPASRDAAYLKARLKEVRDRNLKGESQVKGENPKVFDREYSNIYGNLLDR